MKHFGNFVALLIVAVNALFTGLLLLVAYSPYIQPATHPVQSCLGLTFPVFALINGGCTDAGVQRQYSGICGRGTALCQ